MTMRTADKYRVQTKFRNPEAVIAHSGREFRWVDASAHHTKGEAARARKDGQRIIKICTPSEGALLVDRGAYSGRRFNVIVTPEGN